MRFILLRQKMGLKNFKRDVREAKAITISTEVVLRDAGTNTDQAGHSRICHPSL